MYHLLYTFHSISDHGALLTRKTVLSLCAFLGIAMCIYMVYVGKKNPAPAPIIFPPAVSPYQHFVAGEGIIESVHKNINIGVPFGELITEIYIKEGDIIEQNTPLFKLDTRQLEANLKEANAALQVARVDYENQKKQYSFYTRLNVKNAVSEQSYSSAAFNEKKALAQLKKAEASIESIKTNIERSLIKAPIAGEILQLNIRPGEFAFTDASNTQPLILFGDTQFYHLRVNVDEEDAWRIIPRTAATAFVRGNASISIPLKYEYVEPYIVPKESLTGSNLERVDTRVLQIVYSFKKNSLPIYCGQLLDVYIQAHPHQTALE